MNARAAFDELVTWASGTLQGEEVLLASLVGESTDFVRFNHGDVRQAGSIQQQDISVELIDGRRHCSASMPFTGDAASDRSRLGAALRSLREQLRLVPEDPYLNYNTEVTNGQKVTPGELPDTTEVVGEVRSASTGHDLVGILASGDTYRGFANSLGQRNWSSASTFNLDWSMYLQADKAAKNGYAGFEWDSSTFQSKIDWSLQQVDALRRPARTISPGGYRTFLAPAAIEEFMTLLGYSAFGLRAHRTRQTPLLQMVAGDAQLHPRVSLSEATSQGVGPDFQSQGFLRPDAVDLIDRGQYVGHLISPRSAQEYGVATNGASSSEMPESLSLSTGSLPSGEVLEQLGTGLYVGNLWYLNYSDAAACRTTGMTRFATFWVEDGEISAPVNVMRFDDTAFNLLGDRLIDLTDTAEVVLDPMSYHARSTGSFRLPGALVEEMTFTL